MQNLFISGLTEEPVIMEASFTRKFCGIMSLRAGGAIACLIWIGIGLYGCILAFQFKSPLYSYIAEGALIAQGITCVFLVLAAGSALAGLYLESMLVLNHAHRVVWLTVICFLVDFMVTIIVFGIGQQDNANWCYEESLGQVDDQVTLGGSAVNYTVPINMDFYNCSKIWQDELKFAIALMIIFLIFFLYWAWCLWAYTQKLRIILNPANFKNYFIDNGAMGMPVHDGMGPPPMGPPMEYMNMPSQQNELPPGAYPSDIEAPLTHISLKMISSRA
ncbi:hypothetical protein DM01DRAFT_1383774 [Hesseltinella vesiculosa]|uniref:MARVEL domain-containing protein n=1 Tax=Hesseltinella vesiculosa TaxID=101127 RepID=A0A1X2GGD4_9FUNG|nr:hypothetical protein DM01DRAFT_1383774 [Hesseltinella vesiculosa]